MTKRQHVERYGWMLPQHDIDTIRVPDDFPPVSSIYRIYTTPLYHLHQDETLQCIAII